ncbi:Rossmann-like and DUF2520 domain-containing protein [Aequorivita echinoideorum]|uniref:DUF2520 domain-containing protein n=1 Tax=Aequorivita echinoideorum TaxID=1549647 RepID=A0ABS5S6R5_9FLAO|nr:DUF2520 domain-containing protein [Aequorivita echinoideorum]MBT0608899.1 DUF2520 domain-containing protein [Aequorivita echinoideorum]
MIEVVFLGFGNVNQHLCKAFLQCENVTVKQIFNRNFIKSEPPFENIPFVEKMTTIETADVYIIGIPDDAIADFSEKLPFQNKLVVHTSGGVHINTISEKNRRGVFYPLQTFSKQRQMDFKTVPICLEAEKDSDLKLLQQLAGYISNTVVEISSEKRAKLHLAAVFVNNFTNYLYRIGNEILAEENLPFNLLKPLILETSEKIQNLDPREAQTGPAARNDLKTIEKHLHLLTNGEHKKLYELFTNQLKSNDGKKL